MQTKEFVPPPAHVALDPFPLAVAGEHPELPVALSIPVIEHACLSDPLLPIPPPLCPVQRAHSAAVGSADQLLARSEPEGLPVFVRVHRVPGYDVPRQTPVPAASDVALGP